MAKIGSRAALALVLTTGCGAMRPQVYPNDHYQQVGQAAAERDIEECQARAREFVDSGGGTGGQRAAEAARNTGVGAVVGAASGAVGGAIGGNAGLGAGIGAASGATAGLLGTMFGWMFRRETPDPVYANFVDQCLRERGYQPIGWK